MKADRVAMAVFCGILAVVVLITGVVTFLVLTSDAHDVARELGLLVKAFREAAQ